MQSEYNIIEHFLTFPDEYNSFLKTNISSIKDNTLVNLPFTSQTQIRALSTINEMKKVITSIEEHNTLILVHDVTSERMLSKRLELSDLVKTTLNEKALREKTSAPQLNERSSKNNSTGMKALINEPGRKIKSNKIYANLDRKLLQRTANYEEGLKQNKLNIIERNKRIKENRNIENAKRQTMKQRVIKRRNANNHVRLSLKKLNKQNDTSLNNNWTDIGKPYTESIL